MLTKAVPWITVHLNGVIQPAILTECECLTIWIPSSTAPPTISLNEHMESSKEHEDSNLLDEVDQFLNNNNATDQEDAPNWEFKEGEYKLKDPNYIFCPAPHRKPLLHLFTKHFCHHPIFLECNLTCLTASEIWHNAVTEMYQFCYQRGLSEVWGYMWTSWYQPKVWKIWAHSSSYLSRLWTTMMVKNFWCQLKHFTSLSSPSSRSSHLDSH